MKHLIVTRGTMLVGFLLLLLTAASIAPDCAYACTCLPPGPPAQELAGSSAVFAGKVTSFSAPSTEGTSTDARTATFEVSQMWKGARQGTIVATTPRDSAGCGFEFEVGREYLVYAGTTDGKLSVSLCSRTQQLSDAAADLQALGSGTMPNTGADAPLAANMPIFLLIPALGVVLVLIGAITIRRR